MNKTRITAILAATTMIAGMFALVTLSAVAQPAYTQLDSASKDQSDDSLKLSVNAGGDIPRSPDDFVNSVPVFGYAWVDLDTGKGVVAAIHPSFRDSHQNPDAWHTHPLTLSEGTNGKVKSDFCIASLGTSQGGLSIHDDVMDLNIEASEAGVSASELDAAVSFVVQLDSKCASGLGVVVLDVAAL